MKKLLLLLVLQVALFANSQNKKHILSKFDTSGMETSILLQKSPLVDLNAYNESAINNYRFYQAYKSISQSDLAQRLLPLQTLKNLEKENYLSSTIPLAILISDYETIKPEAFQNNTITQDHEGYLLRTNSNASVFNLNSIAIASAIKNKHKGLNANYTLSTENIYNTTGKTIQNISVDFNDGLGFKTIALNENIAIQYNLPGKKTLQFKIELDSGELLLRKSTITIKYSNSDLHTLYNRTINTITATTITDLSMYGEAVSHPGTGEYEIFLSDDNILDKPIFLVDGFDPNDGRDITGIYELLNFEDNGTTSNLGDLVRTEGFDVIILNFPEYTRAADNTFVDGGVDFIERNAMLLVDLITLINTQKIGSEPNVVIGPSMGGLISRFALNYMESESLSHDTRLWISFDSPHHGANVPIGFQHQFNYLAYGLNDFFFIGNQNVEELQPVINGMLKSNAGRQMLTDQLEAHFVSNNSQEVEFDSNLTLPQAHPFKNIFFYKLNTLTASGFPEDTRNVAIINGSGINARYPDVNGINLTPGRQILNTTFNVATGTDATLRVNFTPSATLTAEASYVYIDFAWYVPAFDVSSSANSRAYNYSNGIDAASGGLFDLEALTEDFDTTGLVGDFLNNLQTNYFNFIPSVSGMALDITNNQINWFHTPNNVTTNSLTTTNTTPFENWYMPDDNEPHVTLTQGNVAFALAEIIPETLHVDAFLDEIISIEKNPISDNITLLSSNTFEAVKINIIDITGKSVFNNTQTLQNRTLLPLDLASGLYILGIETKNGLSLKTKFLVE
ncbi:T9SS type A sorting domain-containing protein [Lacinutrix salivirga]